MRSFDELLAEAGHLHGHVCAGQVLGVRMAMLGCRYLGIDEPHRDKRLIVFVEIDRCAADAVQTVTGCKLGKRTLKYVDNGKVAATFLDVSTGKALRVVARDDSRTKAPLYAPPGGDKKHTQLEAYKVMPEQELFTWQPVAVELAPQDLPGPPRRRTTCQRCGESVSDSRDVEIDGQVLCRACAHGSYYQPLPIDPPSA